MTTLTKLFGIGICVCSLVATVAPTEAKGLKGAKTPKAAHTGSGERVMLEITGVEGPQAVAALDKSFADNGVKAKVKEGKKSGKSLRVMAAVDTTTDLSPLAKAVNSAVPAKASQTPASLDLVFYASLTKESAAKAMEGLEKLKGVDAKGSSLDAKRGMVTVRINGSDHVTAEEIGKAVTGAGLADVHFVKGAKTKKT
jgi:hypothetical protein